MSPSCYYEVGVQLKHVKYAVKLPDLHSIKLNKTKLRIKMKKPKLMMRRRDQKKRKTMDTGSLASINVDWKKEFEDKYAELLSKTARRKCSKLCPEESKEKLSQDLLNISLIANTSYITDSPVNLSITEPSEAEILETEELSEDQENINLLSGEPVGGRRRILKYKYHTLRTKQ